MQIKTKIVSSHTADSKLVKQEVNSTVILPPLVFPGLVHLRGIANCQAEKNIHYWETISLAHHYKMS
jgi:hypothetical protein